MENLIANIGRTQKRSLNGRQYVVAPVTMIVPGVLPGSKGPLYYPPDEVANQQHVDSWNGMPLVVYHPKKGNNAVSARSPDVVEVGKVYNSTFSDGKLKAEAWIDIEIIKNVSEGGSVLMSIEQGTPVEVSTGLYTQNREAPPGSVDPATGVPYTHIATNYRPDHLAILPSQTGACSIRDGCGLLANQQQQPQQPAMTLIDRIENAKKGGGGWVTLDSGQKMFISGAGKFMPSGPGSGSKPKSSSAEPASAPKKPEEAPKPQAPAAAPAAPSKIKNLSITETNMLSALSRLGEKGILSSQVLPNGRYDNALRALVQKGAAKYDKDKRKYVATEAGTSHLKSSNLSDGGLDSRSKMARLKPTVNTETPMNKDQLVNWLTTNCSCWKGEKDRETLNGFDEAKLTQLKTAAESAKANETVVNATKEALGFDFDITANGMVGDLMKGKWKKDEEEPEDPKAKKKPTTNETPVIPSFKEYMDKHATPEERAVWNNVVQIEAAERARLAGLLVANTADANAKAAALAIYGRMSLDQLRPLVAALPTPTVNATPTLPSYFGANPAPAVPTTNDATFNRNNVMPIAHMDFDRK